MSGLKSSVVIALSSDMASFTLPVRSFKSAEATFTLSSCGDSLVAESISLPAREVSLETSRLRSTEQTLDLSTIVVFSDSSLDRNRKQVFCSSQQLALFRLGESRECSKRVQ